MPTTPMFPPIAVATLQALHHRTLTQKGILVLRSTNALLIILLSRCRQHGKNLEFSSLIEKYIVRMYISEVGAFCLEKTCHSQQDKHQVPHLTFSIEVAHLATSLHLLLQRTLEPFVLQLNKPTSTLRPGFPAEFEQAKQTSFSAEIGKIRY